MALQQPSEEQGEQTVPAADQQSRQFPRRLPEEIWDNIVSCLSGELSALLNIASLNSGLRSICRPYLSCHFDSIAGQHSLLPHPNYYHDLVWLILEGYVDASAPTTLYCHGARPGLWSVPTERLFGRTATAAEKHSFHIRLTEALNASPCVTPELRSQVCERFHQSNDPDAALVVLLVLCIRLKMMVPPFGLEMCATLFESILREHTRRGTNALEARAHANQCAQLDRDKTWTPFRGVMESECALPLSQLLILHAPEDSASLINHPLVEIIPFMAVPSLQRIVLGGVCDRESENWPDEFHITCPEIYFSLAEVSGDAVRAFAQSIQGPCEIRQWYMPNYECDHEHTTREPEWDRVIISTPADGARKVEVRFDFEGGSPGRNYPWVSWLASEKMLDWRRINEEFSLDPGDQGDQWLGSLW